MNNPEIKKIIANAAVNASLESKKLSDDTIKMIESCLKTDNGSFLFNLYLKTRSKDGGVQDDYVNENTTSKYCYDNGVLKNYYDIRDWELLHIVDGDSAAYYQSQIVSGESNYRFAFDINSYLNLHRKLFSTVYPFAGEIRDEFIYKSCKPYLDRKTPFCLPQNIENCLRSTLLEMKYKISKLSSREDLLKYLAHYYGELNMIHPFREGNGRTLRTYFLLLVKSNSFSFGNFELDYSLWNEEDMKTLTKATIINSITCDIDGIYECFDKILISNVKRKSR